MTSPHATVVNTPETWTASPTMYAAQAARKLAITLRVGSRNLPSRNVTSHPKAAPARIPPNAKPKNSQRLVQRQKLRHGSSDGKSIKYQPSGVVDLSFRLQATPTYAVVARALE